MTREYAAAVAELGGEVRTLDEFFNRMIVVDRRVAVIPAPDDLSVALTIREPTVVAYLVDVFLRAWERARPFSSRDDKAMRQIAEEQRAMTMRMLIEGHSDPVSAKRLGVSPRTYAATSPTSRRSSRRRPGSSWATRSGSTASQPSLSPPTTPESSPLVGSAHLVLLSFTL